MRISEASALMRQLLRIQRLSGDVVPVAVVVRARLIGLV
jgi:hypothetical protein